MQSADSITTAASVPVIRRLPHEYERDTLSFRYEQCKSCKNRTQLTCIKCGFCYSCHWKKEEVEKKEFRNKLESIYLSSLSSSKPRDESTTAEEDDDELQKQKEEEEQEEEQETEQSQGMIVNVFGQKSEPICTYYRCHHKFSLHGIGRSYRCKCKHPMNKTLGVFKIYS
jgi:hypothetical protein